MRLFAANHSTKFSAAPSPPSERGGARGAIEEADSSSGALLALQFGGLLHGAVLVEQLQHFVLVVEHLHHGVPGLGDLVHHQLAALHVTLGTETTTVSWGGTTPRGREGSFWDVLAGLVNLILKLLLALFPVVKTVGSAGATFA